MSSRLKGLSRAPQKAAGAGHWQLVACAVPVYTATDGDRSWSVRFLRREVPDALKQVCEYFRELASSIECAGPVGG